MAAFGFPRFLVFVLMAIASLALLISLATNYWIKHSNTHHQGLWFYCNDEDTGCLHFDQDPDYRIVPDWHYAVFGLILVAAILHLVAVIVSILTFFFKDRQCFYITNMCVLGFSWLCLVTALSMYTRNFQRLVGEAYKWGYSFGLAWFSFIFHTLALFIVIFLYLKDK